MHRSNFRYDDMLLAVLPFLIWGGTGSVVKALHAEPILLAIFRYSFCGLLLAAANRVNRRAVAWRDPDLWLSAIVMLLRNIFYMLSIASGPTVIVSIAYGYVPLAVALIAEVFALERRQAMTRMHWLGLLTCFLGNFIVLRSLSAQQIEFGLSGLYAIAAAVCFALTPLLTLRLHKKSREMDALTVLRGQTSLIAAISVPLLLALQAAGAFGEVDGAQLARTLGASALVCVAFTLVPFYLWYKTMFREGAARTAALAFVEPLTTTLISLFVLREAELTLFLMTGFFVLGLGIGLNSLASRTKVAASQFRVALPRAGAYWRAFRVFGVHIVALPFAAPVVLHFAFQVSWQAVADLYLSWGFTCLNGFGFVVAWALWKSSRFKVHLLSLYLLAAFGESIHFLHALALPVPSWSLFAVSLIAVAPGLWLLRTTRHAPRFGVRIAIALIGRESMERVACDVTSLSETGCRMTFAEAPTKRLETELKKGALVTLVLERSETPLAASARLVWRRWDKRTKKFVCGVRFEKTSADELVARHRLLSLAVGSLSTSDREQRAAS